MSVVIFQNGKPISNNQAQEPSESYDSPKKQDTLANNKAIGYMNNKVDSNNRRRLIALHVMSTSVVTCNINTSIKQAIELISNYDFSHLVIVDNNKKPVGVIHFNQLINNKKLEESTVSQLLDDDFRVVFCTTLVRDIASSFIQHKKTAVVVVDEQHQLAGVISQNDLMGLLVSSPNQKIIV